MAGSLTVRITKVKVAPESQSVESHPEPSIDNGLVSVAIPSTNWRFAGDL